MLENNLNIMSRDTAFAIRHFCFNNLAEFYGRYHSELNMSKATFHRIISGEVSTTNNIQDVENLARKLQIVFGDDNTVEWLSKKQMVSNLLKLNMRLLRNPSVKCLEELKEFIDNYKELMT